jgi:hypothetical protein
MSQRGIRTIALFLLSLFSLFERIVPTYYFAAALIVWALLSAYKLIALRARASSDEKDHFAYWAGALGSSLFVPLLWMLVVSQIRPFSSLLQFRLEE